MQGKPHVSEFESHGDMALELELIYTSLYPNEVALGGGGVCGCKEPLPGTVIWGLNPRARTQATTAELHTLAAVVLHRP